MLGKMQRISLVSFCSVFLSLTLAFTLGSPAQAAKTASAACPEKLEKLEAGGVIEQHGLERSCVVDSEIKYNASSATAYIVSVKGVKAKLIAVVPVEGEPYYIKTSPKGMQTAALAPFQKALPLARQMTLWSNVLNHSYTSRDGDLCLETTGPKDVLVGMVEVCAASTKSLKVKEKIQLAPKALSLEAAQKLAVKEFARIEKEEDIPSVKEVFGDKDTVSQMAIAPEGKKSYYFFWMSQFSDSGVILMAVFMNGSVKSEVVKNVFEYDRKLVRKHIQKWHDEAK